MEVPGLVSADKNKLLFTSS